MANGIPGTGGGVRLDEKLDRPSETGNKRLPLVYTDEFMYEYKDDIAQRQDKIINYSNENDYVNILLNVVGEKHDNGLICHGM